MQRPSAAFPLSSSGPGNDPAHLLTADLPRDQALGLRLIALARAAGAMHMAERAPTRSGQTQHAAFLPPLGSSQAAALLDLCSEGAA